MVGTFVLGVNLFGTKAIIAYVIVIVAIVAIVLYTRRGGAGSL